MSAAEVITQPTLEELAATANREHALAEEAASSYLDHAIAAGDALNAALAEHCAQHDGAKIGWEQWLAKNFDGSLTAGRNYMRVARLREHIPPGATSYREVCASLVGISEPWIASTKVGDSAKALARDLYAKGLSKAEISRVVGHSDTIVGSWVDPEVLKRTKESNARTQRALRERRREARLIEQERAKQLLARKVKGPASEAYSLIRRCLQTIDQAHAEAETQEARQVLTEAMRWMHMAEDAIVKAMKEMS